MELRDLIVTPILIILIYAIAYLIRPMLANSITIRYYFPALTVKITGAIAVGMIYQFYYQGGDTFNFFTYGSNIVWKAMMTDFSDGIKLLLHSDDPSLIKYTALIPFYDDPSSFFVIRVAAFFDIITFSTYSATAVLFAFFSFLGMWLMFLTFYDLFPHLHRRLAIGVLFIPSVFFWGSGVLKDTIIMACLGVITYEVKKLLLDKKFSISSIFLLLLSLIISFQVKKYVLMCFIPAALFWVYSSNLVMIKSAILRIFLVPVVLVIALGSGFYAIQKIGEDDPRYAIDKLAFTARETAYDIRFYTGRDAGSGYTLGELDGSFGSMLNLAPAAINVSLFRPYPWEVVNPLMLLSSIESFTLLVITLYLVITRIRNFFRALGTPTVLFCFIFSITFAFAVGIATYNFGTLARYKIPLLPFYAVALILIADYSNRDKKLEALDLTE